MPAGFLHNISSHASMVVADDLVPLWCQGISNKHVDLKQSVLSASLHDVEELILGLHPASERRCYFVSTSLIGWTQA